MTFCNQSFQCFLYIPLITEEASKNGFPLSVALFIHNAFSQATCTDNVREGRIGGGGVGFWHGSQTKKKNHGSLIKDIKILFFHITKISK